MQDRHHHRNRQYATSPMGRWLVAALVLAAWVSCAADIALAQDTLNRPATTEVSSSSAPTAKPTSSPSSSPSSTKIPSPFGLDPDSVDRWTGPEGLSSALKVMLILTVISLAPAILLMTTCFVRVIVVLGLLRQALGTQQLPPSQVITSLAMFITLLVMTPVWQKAYNNGIKPYTDGQISLEEAWTAGARPVRQFMAAQIERTGNTDDIRMFYQYLPEETPEPETYDDVPIRVLLPAFMLSELKTAFLIGFQIYLPFVILDMVVASVTISMGMLMLPPVLISLPFKLLLFVLVDGWHLVVGMLMESFQMVT